MRFVTVKQLIAFSYQLLSFQLIRAGLIILDSFGLVDLRGFTQALGHHAEECAEVFFFPFAQTAEDFHQRK